MQEIPVFKESCSDDTRVADIAACRKAREQRAAAAPTSEGGGAREAGTVLLRAKGTGNTQQFTSAGDWDLRWSFVCDGEGYYSVDPRRLRGGRT